MLVDLLVLSLLTPAFCLLDQIGLKQIDSNARVFYEIETRREIIFHGVNAIVKGFPWVPSTTDFDIDTSLVDKDHEMLADLGVNMYRLGSMWPGVEPNRGKYNITYLTEMNKIIDASAKYGIYTLLDMHQDVLSEKYCGEGVPAWAAESFLPRDDAKFPAPIDTPYQDVADDGFPTRQDCGLHGWAQYYNTRATADAFESLYTNRTNLLSAWGEMWRTFARVLGSPNLLGYELINEP